MDETEAVSILRQRFRAWANSVAARYGHPVYLVGSALRAVTLEDVYKLRDVDIVCILPDDEFAARFCHWTWACNGDDKLGANRWAAEVGKLSRRASMDMRNVNVDFKVQSQEWAEHQHAGQPRVRIDTAAFEMRLVMTNEPLSKGPTAIVKNSLEHRLREMRAAERRCRRAYTKGEMRLAGVMLADVYDEAANVFRRGLRRFEEYRCSDPACDCNGGETVRCV